MPAVAVVSRGEGEEARGQSRRGGVKHRRSDGKTNAAARWRGVGCCTSTEAETYPGRIEGLAFAAVHRAEDATRERVARRSCVPRISFRSSSLCPHEVTIFLCRASFPSGSAAAHTSLRVRASTRRRGRCSRRRRQPRRARPPPRGRHRCPGSAGRDARDSPTPTRPRGGPSAARPSVARSAPRQFPRGREGAGRGRGSPRA